MHVNLGVPTFKFEAGQFRTESAIDCNNEGQIKASFCPCTMADPKPVGKFGLPLAKANLATQDHHLQSLVCMQFPCSQRAQSVLLCAAQRRCVPISHGLSMILLACHVFTVYCPLPTCAHVCMGSSCSAATLPACHALCGPPAQASSL